MERSDHKQQQVLALTLRLFFFLLHQSTAFLVSHVKGSVKMKIQCCTLLWNSFNWQGHLHILYLISKIISWLFTACPVSHCHNHHKQTNQQLRADVDSLVGWTPTIFFLFHLTCGWYVFSHILKNPWIWVGVNNTGKRCFLLLYIWCVTLNNHLKQRETFLWCRRKSIFH